MLKIKKNDTVEVITGKNRGVRGKVLEVRAKSERLVVEKVNMVTKHIKPTQGAKGKRIETEGSIHISNVMLVDPSSDKKTRVGFSVGKDGTKVRIAKKSNKEIA